jgi:hypothetical protein
MGSDTAWKNSNQSRLPPAQRSLDSGGHYLCPVCRHGQISAIVLMDAFSCSFCRHIFTVDYPNQSVRVEDSSQPMVWRWTGHKWLMAHQVDGDLSIVVWVVATVIAILPPTLIWLSSHTFPPMPGTVWYWFPLVWVTLAFLAHATLVGWLLVEHYQLPLYVALKVRLRMWAGQR